MSNTGSGISPQTESKPSILLGAICRLRERVSRIEDLIRELRAESGSGETPAKAKLETNNFEYVYSSAPSMIEELITRTENAAATLREMLL